MNTEEVGMISEFVTGKAYFLLQFFDEDLVFPTIKTLVYIGKNIEGVGKDRDLWFFQDASSYVNIGPYAGDGKDTSKVRNKKRESPSAQVFDFPEEQLSQILSLEELITRLNQITD